MNLWIDTARDDLTRVIRRVDLVLIAEDEAREYADTPSLRAAARHIFSLGPKLLVIKQGSYGALLFGADGSFFAAPAYPLEDVRDPTGAGDAFAGGFLGYLASRLTQNGHADAAGLPPRADPRQHPRLVRLRAFRRRPACARSRTTRSPRATTSSCASPTSRATGRRWRLSLAPASQCPMSLPLDFQIRTFRGITQGETIEDVHMAMPRRRRMAACRRESARRPFIAVAASPDACCAARQRHHRRRDLRFVVAPGGAHRGAPGNIGGAVEAGRRPTRTRQSARIRHGTAPTGGAPHHI